MTNNSAESGAAKRWLTAWHHLHALDERAPVPRADVAQLLSCLPERSDHESLTEWLGRFRAPTARVIPFPGGVRSFKPVAEFYRMAADSGSERLPLPETTLESADGRLWLSVHKDGDRLVLTIQAVGMAIDELAGRSIGLAAADSPDTLLAIVALDEAGEGNCIAEDTDPLRRALLHPVVGLVEFSEP